MVDPLDNVIWSALTGPHAALAEGGSEARRYPAALAPFCAVRTASPECFHALARLTAGEDHVTLFNDGVIEPTVEFELVRSAVILQMVKNADGRPPQNVSIVRLGTADAAEIWELAEATKPGPFRSRTSELGGFLGIRIAGALVAMAGERMRVTGCAEVSAVCTRADHRGKGYAAQLVQAVCGAIAERGETPFLHVFGDNAAAISLYRALGFVERKVLEVTVLRNVLAVAGSE